MSIGETILVEFLWCRWREVAKMGYPEISLPPFAKNCEMKVGVLLTRIIKDKLGQEREPGSGGGEKARKRRSRGKVEDFLIYLFKPLCAKRENIKFIFKDSNLLILNFLLLICLSSSEERPQIFLQSLLDENVDEVTIGKGGPPLPLRIVPPPRTMLQSPSATA